jgi:hypothetical protein
MSADEREYLFALVQHRPAPPAATRAQAVSPTVTRMLDALAVPAIVMTARWDVIAWNRLARVFREYDKLPPDRRNLLRALLVDDEAYQQDPAAYEAMARRILAKFRIDYSQAPDDPAFEELISELSARCPIFRRLWSRPEVVGRSEAIAHHPRFGGMMFEHSSYVPEGSPALRLVIFVPHDEVTVAKVRSLAADDQLTTGRRSATVN